MYVCTPDLKEIKGGLEKFLKASWVFSDSSARCMYVQAMATAAKQWLQTANCSYVKHLQLPPSNGNCHQTAAGNCRGARLTAVQLLCSCCAAVQLLYSYCTAAVLLLHVCCCTADARDPQAHTWGVTLPDSPAHKHHRTPTKPTGKPPPLRHDPPLGA